MRTEDWHPAFTNRATVTRDGAERLRASILEFWTAVGADPLPRIWLAEVPWKNLNGSGSHFYLRSDMIRGLPLGFTNLKALCKHLPFYKKLYQPQNEAA